MRRVALISWLLFTATALFTPATGVRHVSRALASLPLLRALFGTTAYQSIGQHDGVWHGTLFSVLAFLVLWQSGRPGRSQVLAGLVALTAFSLASEGIQEWLVPGRAFEWSDLIANQVAVLLGAGAALCGHAWGPALASPRRRRP